MLAHEELLKLANKYLENETNPVFREELQKVLEAKDWNELNDRFYTSLKFGTGGMRGVIGGGSNRMNPYNIARAAQGIANYLNANMEGEKSGVVAYDSRLYSDLFSETVARVFAANKIKCYLFSSLRPTPVLSYAVRYLGCSTGAVVTASHNPQEYNGFKVYWNNGGQVIAPHDSGIIESFESVTEIKMMDKDEAIEKDLIQIIDKEIDDPFVEMVKSYSLRPDVIKAQSSNTKIVYTPLNGTGRMMVERILSEMGIEVMTVPEQAKPDGTFPTCPYPNPESAETMQLALELGTKEKADLVMGTDPDADRLGIAVPNGAQWQLITGNQLGSMLTYYLFSTLKEQGKLAEKSALIKTIVTTRLAQRIAESFGAEVADVLTGFKWIAEKMDQYEKEGRQFVLGYEESYGFNLSNQLRDKDAVGAVAMTAEMALYCVSKGISLLDYLNQIYQQYGYFEEFQIAKVFKGESGLLTMKALMDSIRKEPPMEIGGKKTIITRDFLTSVQVDYQRENTTPIKSILNFPKSNVLQFELEDGSVFTIRPSGTEPKVKFYGSCHSDILPDLFSAKKIVAEKVNAIKSTVKSILKEFEV